MKQLMPRGLSSGGEKRSTKIVPALLAGTIAASAFQISPSHAADGPSPGEYLARAGNCVVCHTVPGGRPFAGGLKMATPGGVIYSTNITVRASTDRSSDRVAILRMR